MAAFTAVEETSASSHRETMASHVAAIGAKTYSKVAYTSIAITINAATKAVVSTTSAFASPLRLLVTFTASRSYCHCLAWWVAAIIIVNRYGDYYRKSHHHLPPSIANPSAPYSC